MANDQRRKRKSVAAFFRRLPLFTLWAGFSLAYGLLVPSLYEFTQNPVARIEHSETELAACAVLVITLAAATVFWLLNRPSESTPQVGPAFRKFQFGLREMLVAVTLIGVVCGSVRFMGLMMLSWIVVLAALGAGMSSIYGGRSVRSRSWAILAAMFLPFSWMVLKNVPFGYTSGLAIHIPLSPAFFPLAMTQALFSGNSAINSYGASAVLVIAELAVGSLLAWRGGKLALIYVAAVFVNSAFGSFGIHALYRM
jgi:hypothetical protein